MKSERIIDHYFSNANRPLLSKTKIKSKRTFFPRQLDQAAEHPILLAQSTKASYTNGGKSLLHELEHGI